MIVRIKNSHDMLLVPFKNRVAAMPTSCASSEVSWSLLAWHQALEPRGSQMPNLGPLLVVSMVTALAAPAPFLRYWTASAFLG